MGLFKRTLLPAYLALCLILGGASAAGFVANFLLQFLGALLLAWSFWGTTRCVACTRTRFLTFLIYASLFLAAVQFLPLPESIWTSNAARAELAAEAGLAGVGDLDHAWSLLPHSSFRSIMWMVPALFLTVAMLRLPDWRPSDFAWVVVAIASLSVLLGAMQLVQGNASPAYFYDITNLGSSVGLFSNSNHLATLMLMAVPFIFALFSSSRRDGRSYPLYSLAMGGTFLLIILSGIAMNGSLAGYGLVGPVVVASGLMLFPAKRLRRITLFVIPLGLIALISWLFLAPSAQQFLAVSNLPGDTGRPFIWTRTIAAIWDYMPLGTGFGTFADVFTRYEDPALVSNVYVNHAHNDYLEFILEGGVLGILFLIAFGSWWCLRARQIWLAGSTNCFAQAAMIASGAVLLHSLVDYPLRTAAVSSLFGACVVMMTLWVPGDRILVSPGKPKEPTD